MKTTLELLLMQAGLSNYPYSVPTFSGKGLGGPKRFFRKEVDKLFSVKPIESLRDISIFKYLKLGILCLVVGNEAVAAHEHQPGIFLSGHEVHDTYVKGGEKCQVYTRTPSLIGKWLGKQETTIEKCENTSEAD